MKTNISALGIALIFASCAGVNTPKTDEPPPMHSNLAEAPKPKPYPLTTCLVSEEDLDEMDERVSKVYKGQTFEFCCKPCLVKFNKDPEKYASKLAAAKKTQQ
jgi:YHS domain-containing protein